MSMASSLEPVTMMPMALFGKEVFADGVKLRILRGDHCVLSGWALNPMAGVLVRVIIGEGAGVVEKAQA